MQWKSTITSRRRSTSSTTGRPVPQRLLDGGLLDAEVAETTAPGWV